MYVDSMKENDDVLRTPIKRKINFIIYKIFFLHEGLLYLKVTVYIINLLGSAQ